MYHVKLVDEVSRESTIYTYIINFFKLHWKRPLKLPLVLSKRP